MRPVDGEIIRPILCLSRDKIAEYLKEKKISHIQDSTNLSDEYTRNRIRHHILPILEQQVNGKAAAHMAETAARISQAEEYLTQQSCLVLGEFQKGKEYYFTEKFFMEPQIIQVYALQQAMEQLAGRRKDLAAVHYEKAHEKETFVWIYYVYLSHSTSKQNILNLIQKMLVSVKRIIILHFLGYDKEFQCDQVKALHREFVA